MKTETKAINVPLADLERVQRQLDRIKEGLQALRTPDVLEEHLFGLDDLDFYVERAIRNLVSIVGDAALEAT